MACSVAVWVFFTLMVLVTRQPAPFAVGRAEAAAGTVQLA